ncbi:MAG: hypothetical protein WDN46_05780 [Methylocella sp.]
MSGLGSERIAGFDPADGGKRQKRSPKDQPPLAGPARKISDDRASHMPHSFEFILANSSLFFSLIVYYMINSKMDFGDA